MNNHESLKNVIGLVNQGKSYPALKLVEENPGTAALVSKLIKSRETNEFDLRKRNADSNLNQSQIQAISESTKNRSRDNENILQLFPDIELAVQILVSSILSPKDMVKTDLIYKSKEPILPSELLLKLNGVITSHFENYYGIRDELQEILRDTLFNTGSYIKAVIPESLVDEIINQNRTVSTESLSEIFNKDRSITGLGILGNAGVKKESHALESFFDSSNRAANYNSKVSAKNSSGNEVVLEHLEVSDNYRFLKMPKIIEVANKQKIKSLVKGTRSFGIESMDKGKKLSVANLTNMTYKGNSPESQSFLVIPAKGNSKRKSIGRPLVMRLPSESVIPVYIPGDESKHIGYFVLVDAEGNPVSRNSGMDSSEGLSGLVNNGSQNTSLSSMLINKAKKNLADSSTPPTLDHITKVYSSIIETDLMERLSNGVYGSNVQISENEEIYRIMLARSLSSKYTRLIYLPAELATYFAFNYFPNGVGKSYLDGVKNLTSLRAILLFAKVMAMVKSSINVTHVDITLDPEDPDPQKTIEMSQHEIIKMRQNYFPLGINSPTDLTDWIQRAGMEFSFQGHPGLPLTKFDFESKSMQHQVPDSELDELLRKQTYMAFGLSPETIDTGFNSELATSIVANNVLLSKRIIQLQHTFTRQLTDHARKLISNDSFAMKELYDVLQENLGLVESVMTEEEKASYIENKEAFLNDVVERVIENLLVDLPRPDVTSLQNQMLAFKDYSEALEEVIDSWISTDFITSDIAGEISNNIDAVKAVIKGYYIRRWMSENGFMAELNDIVTTGEDGKATVDLYDINKNHMEGIVRSSLQFIKSMKPVKEAADKDLETMGTPAGEPSSDSGSDADSTGDDMGDDMAGMDGMDTTDTPPVDEGDEAEPTEETPEETPPV